MPPHPSGDDPALGKNCKPVHQAMAQNVTGAAQVFSWQQRMRKIRRRPEQWYKRGRYRDSPKCPCDRQHRGGLGVINDDVRARDPDAPEHLVMQRLQGAPELFPGCESPGSGRDIQVGQGPEVHGKLDVGHACSACLLIIAVTGNERDIMTATTEARSQGKIWLDVTARAQSRQEYLHPSPPRTSPHEMISAKISGRTGSKR